jgi:hypothetical protein
MYKLIQQSKYDKLLNDSRELQQLSDKYNEVKQLLTLTQHQNFDFSAEIEELKEQLDEMTKWYDDMIAVENKMYDTKYEDFFEKLPDMVTNTMIEYLNRLKIEFLKLSVKRSNEVEDIIYRNGLFTATESFLKMFAKAKAIKDTGKFETDPLTGKTLQDKEYQELVKKQEDKNV